MKAFLDFLTLVFQAMLIAAVLWYYAAVSQLASGPGTARRVALTALALWFFAATVRLWIELRRLERQQVVSMGKGVNLSHEEKTVIFVLGAMKWLIDEGCFAGAIHLPANIAAQFDQLEAEEFRPTRSEVKAGLDRVREKSVMDLSGMKDADVEEFLNVTEQWDRAKKVVWAGKRSPVLVHMLVAWFWVRDIGTLAMRWLFWPIVNVIFWWTTIRWLIGWFRG